MKSKAQWSPDPSLDVCRVERLADRWLISARTAGSNECPDCSTLSTSRHSSYVRQIQDLPNQGSPVTLSVQLDRWRCQNPHCGRKTFAARLPGTIAGPRARHTDRVIELVKLFAYMAGGRPAERLMAKLGIPVSNDTLLRHLKRHQGRRPVAPIPARVVGVDDWSWVKGESYGTIFVDLERREVLDVLSRRSADDTARWFAERPEVEFISRDRCGVYARGARRGAPTARQVADRFHLLQNLRERIEQQLARSRPSVTTIEASHADSEIRVNGQRAGSAAHAQLVKHGRKSRRQAKFDQVKALQTAGKSLRLIEEITGLNWRTVSKWARSDELPPRLRSAPRSHLLESWRDQLAELWAAGRRNGRELLGTIQRSGYTGSRASLERLLQTWRAIARPERQAPNPPAVINLSEMRDPATSHLISPIVGAALCIKPHGQLTTRQVSIVTALKEICPDFACMRRLAMQFRGIMRSGDLDRLTTWIDEALHCGIYAMQRFARSLKYDLSAVRNAMTTPWSNGQTEGQINRLKTLKRAMYGRAQVELLRARMLPLQTAAR